MKMILAVMPTNISDIVSKSLLDDGYRVTKFASTSGFLSGGITTLMVGVDTNQVEPCLELIRKQIPSEDLTDETRPRVTIYVIKVKDFMRV